MSISSQSDLGRRLAVYDALLKKWQKVINLVAPRTLHLAGMRHFADSLQLLSLVPGAVRWVDMGSGGGFPGLVTALQLADVPGAIVHLIESDQRKCSFLREVSRETGAPTLVHNGRVEDILPTLPPNIEAISARALAPLPRLIALCEEKLLTGAVGVFPKGQDLDKELTSFTIDSRYMLDFVPSATDHHARIVLVRLSDKAHI